MLLVDLDAQSCLTFSLGLDPESVELSVHDVLLGRVGASMAIQPTEDGVDLLPATIELAGTEAQLMSRPGPRVRAAQRAGRGRRRPTT